MDRQTDTHTERWTGRQTHGEIDTQTDTWRDGRVDRHMERLTDRQRYTQTYIPTDKQTDKTQPDALHADHKGVPLVLCFPAGNFVTNLAPCSSYLVMHTTKGYCIRIAPPTGAFDRLSKRSWLLNQCV